jgi:hypothetical protein
MLGGALGGNDYYMGSQPLTLAAERETNPKGVFEDREINAINEALLARVTPRPARTPLGRRLQRQWAPGEGLRWVAIVPPERPIKSSPDIDTRIRAEVQHRPFCFKDPRFCYTLPVWERWAPDVVRICIFREPTRTANSIVTEWARHRRSISMNYQRALTVWRSMYGSVLALRTSDVPWVFVHYDQLLDGSAIPRIEGALDARVDPAFAEPRLKRSRAEGTSSKDDQKIYRALCELASFVPPNASR